MTWRKEHFTQILSAPWSWPKLSLLSLFLSFPSSESNVHLLFNVTVFDCTRFSFLLEQVHLSEFAFISRVTATAKGIAPMQINNQVDNEDISSLGFIAPIAQKWFHVSPCALFVYFSSVHGERGRESVCICVHSLSAGWLRWREEKTESEREKR